MGFHSVHFVASLSHLLSLSLSPFRTFRGETLLALNFLTFFGSVYQPLQLPSHYERSVNSLVPHTTSTTTSRHYPAQQLYYIAVGDLIPQPAFSLQFAFPLQPRAQPKVGGFQKKTFVSSSRPQDQHPGRRIGGEVKGARLESRCIT